MNPALLGSVTSVSWGTADFAARFSGRALGHENALLGMLIVGSLGLTAWVGLARPPLVWEASHLWLLGVAGVGVMTATLLLYQALARGPVTVVAPIVASYPAGVVVIALVLGARPTAVQWLAMAGVMAGVVTVARSSVHFADEDAVAPGELRRTVAISLGAAASFAFAVTAGQAAAPVYGELQTLWVSRLVSLAALLPLFLLPRYTVRLPRRWWPVLVAQGVLDTGAYAALFAAGREPGAEIAAVVASAFGAVTVALARVFLREHMTLRQWGGIVLIFVSVAVLSGEGQGGP